MSEWDCERCGQGRDTREIKMASGGKKTLCFGCMLTAKTEGRVDPDDPRISEAEVEKYND
jgi:hypothetical protein